jgi:uncharacterized protein YukE
VTELEIPGSPGGLEALVSQLRNAAADVDSVRDRVASNGLEGDWSGRAADAFRSSLHQLPGELAKVGGAFGDAAGAIGRFASTLASLQEQARWHNEHVELAEQELREANARRAEAQTKLDAANLKHSLATDPVSLSTAKQAVDLGESMVRQTVADVEDIGTNIAQLLSASEGVRREYEEAVRVCSAALDAARDGGGKLLSGWRSRFDHMVGRLEHGGAALIRDGERGARALDRDLERGLRDFDRQWAGWRKDLEDASEFLGIASIVLLCVPGAGPFLFLGLGVLSAAASGMVLAGDAVDPHDRKHLLGDGFDFGLAVLSIVPAVRAAREEKLAWRVGKDVVQDSRGPIQEIISRKFPEIDKVLESASPRAQRAAHALNAFDHWLGHKVLDEVTDDPQAILVPVRPLLATARMV